MTEYEESGNNAPGKGMRTSTANSNEIPEPKEALLAFISNLKKGGFP